MVGPSINGMCVCKSLISYSNALLTRLYWTSATSVISDLISNATLLWTFLAYISIGELSVKVS